eukprot:CAMPEP_0119409426 /NCGR_PEP_ID=MMETSP1335-20130426/2716_2 /TAXON_ID=259385 /ORGANISM="Chrysoculter rhomboideus, Strain RCC1486" /LENGTH=200 /DNA_ID=CAMNT_0007433797 /DNA_START=118 /DNA_END=722 /DNA_ORIENTATION=-
MTRHTGPDQAQLCTGADWQWQLVDHPDNAAQPQAPSCDACHRLACQACMQTARARSPSPGRNAYAAHPTMWAVGRVGCTQLECPDVRRRHRCLPPLLQPARSVRSPSDGTTSMQHTSDDRCHALKRAGKKVVPLTSTSPSPSPSRVPEGLALHVDAVLADEAHAALAARHTALARSLTVAFWVRVELLLAARHAARQRAA